MPLTCWETSIQCAMPCLCQESPLKIDSGYGLIFGNHSCRSYRPEMRSQLYNATVSDDSSQILAVIPILMAVDVASAVPVPLNGSPCCLVLKSNLCAISVENSKLELIHYI